MPCVNFWRSQGHAALQRELGVPGWRRLHRGVARAFLYYLRRQSFSFDSVDLRQLLTGARCVCQPSLSLTISLHHDLTRVLSSFGRRQQGGLILPSSEGEQGALAVYFCRASTFGVRRGTLRYNGSSAFPDGAVFTGEWRGVFTVTYVNRASLLSQLTCVNF